MQEIAAKIQAKNAELDIAIGNARFSEQMHQRALDTVSNIRREIHLLYKELNVYLGAKDPY